MFRCPKDGTALARHDSLSASKAKYWTCPTCGGRTATLGMLRRSAQYGLVEQLWAAVQAAKAESSRHCPACERPMREATVSLRDEAGNTVALDVCTRCLFVWFDSSEFELLPPTGRRSRPKEKLPLEA